MPSWLTSGRILRVAVILVLAVIGLWAAVPSLFTLVSNRAVVNSRITTASSAIDGTVTVTPTVTLGSRVQQGDVLAQVVNTTLSTRVSELRSELRGWRQELEALRSKRGELKAIQQRLGETSEAYRKAYVERLDARIAEVQAEVEAQRARVVQYAADAQRAERLAPSGNVSQARLDEARAQRREAAAILDSRQAILSRLKGEREAAKDGLLLADDFNNTPYADQRADEIQLRLLDLTTDIAEAQRQIDRIEGEIDSEIERQDLQGWTVLNAPTSGYVWEVRTNTGEFVERARNLIEIVDCSRTFVDVTLQQARLEDVNVGQSVDVELLSTGNRMDGQVMAVRAAANLPDNMALTNDDIGRTFDDLQVLVRVDETLTDEGDHRFCNVGQRALVDFSPGSDPLELVTRGLNRLQRFAGDVL